MIKHTYDFEIYNNPVNPNGTFKTFIVIYSTECEETGKVSEDRPAYFETVEEIAVFLKKDRPKPLKSRIYKLYA